MAKETKLHEILACEQDVRNKSKSIVDEAVDTFNKKQTHFDGGVKQYQSIEEGDEVPTDTKEVVTTVAEKMEHVTKAVIEAINVTLTKEETNASGTAKADLIISDKNFGQFSATGLLSLENTLIKLRNTLYKEIPTLDPATAWNKDTDSTRPGMFKSDTTTKYRTINRTKPIIAAPATEQHPAQVYMEKYDVQVGKYLTTQTSGKIRVKSKAAIIERLDAAIFATKQARAKANNVAIVPATIGADLMAFIHGQDLI